MSEWDKRRKVLLRTEKRRINLCVGTMILTAVMCVAVCSFLTKYLDEKEKAQMFLMLQEKQKQK